MARMLLRAFFLSVAVLGCSAATANAAIADRLFPVLDATSGVTGGKSAHGVYLRFGPKAAKAYAALAGKKVTVGCGHPVPGDGSFTSTGMSDTAGHDVSTTSSAGMTWTELRLPRKRGRVDLPFGGTADVCFISGEQAPRSDVCVDAVPHDSGCVKLVVALTAQGHVDIDERSRALELTGLFGFPLAEVQQEFGADVVALDSPDASPPPGKLGIYSDAQTTVAAALLRDGKRRFMRQDGELFTTNVPALAGGRGMTSLF
jgi:hypothetical protein